MAAYNPPSPLFVALRYCENPELVREMPHESKLWLRKEAGEWTAAEANKGAFASPRIAPLDRSG